MKEFQQSHKKVYECFFMELFEDDVLLPNGKISKRIYIEHPGAAAVLPVTTDNKVILIKQFRYPIRQVTLEIPAGKKDDPQETGESCVRRELEEETGYQATSFEHIMDIHNCLGYSDEKIELFLATGAYPVENPIAADDDEFIEIGLYDETDITQLLDTNQITDAKTIIMLQAYLRRLQNTE
jgi:ADP-ribose pyrophosphatase